MDRSRIVLIILALLPSMRAGQPDLPPLEVRACMKLDAPVQPFILQGGEAVASHILSEIGIKLRWSCAAKYDPIEIRVVGHTPENRHPDALACALPYARAGTRITVFYDRFAPFLTYQPCSAPVIFGHVLAHELGHILSGVAYHAQSGLMRANWSSEDLALMRIHNLKFQPGDTTLILRNLTRQLVAMTE